MASNFSMAFLTFHKILKTPRTIPSSKFTVFTLNSAYYALANELPIRMSCIAEFRSFSLNAHYYLIPNDAHCRVLLITETAMLILRSTTYDSYNFHKANFGKLYYNLSHVDSFFLNEFEDRNLAVNQFNWDLYKNFNASVPQFRTVNSWLSQALCFTVQIKRSIKLKHYYRKKWKDTKLPPISQNL